MSTRVLLSNGENVTRDEGIMALGTYMAKPGILKFRYNELAVTVNQVDTGVAFVMAKRTNVTPNEEFLIPVIVDEAVVVDTSGTGFVIISLDQTKINDGSQNESDGSGIATVEVVEELPDDNYLLLATLDAGSITDERIWITLSDNAKPDTIYYAVDLDGNDAYRVQINGLKDLVDGFTFQAKLTTANTGPCTMQVNDFAAKSVNRRDFEELAADDFPENFIANFIYNADEDVFQVTEVASSAAEILKATKEEAEAGTSNDKYVTPLRVSEFYSAKTKMELPAAEDIDASASTKAISILENGGSKTLNYTESILGGANGVFDFDSSGDTYSQGIGRDAEAYKLGYLIDFNSKYAATGELQDMFILMDQDGNPQDNIEVSIHELDGNVPADVPIANGVSIDRRIDEFSGYYYKFVFNTNPTINLDQEYAIIFTRTGAIDNDKYAKIGLAQNSNDGVAFSLNELTEVWTRTENVNHPKILMRVDNIQYTNNACLYDETYESRNFVGFSDSNVLLGQNVSIDTKKLQDLNNLNLDPYKKYYLTNGGVLTTDPGDPGENYIGRPANNAYLPPQVSSRDLAGFSIAANKIKLEYSKPGIIVYSFLLTENKFKEDIQVFLESWFTPKEVLFGFHKIIDPNNAGAEDDIRCHDVEFLNIASELRSNGAIVTIDADYVPEPVAGGRYFIKLVG